jgi:putative peptidoglycan lipid II flippase
MFPYLFFIGLSSTFIAILNSHNIFFITGLSSGLLNIGWLVMLLFGSFVLKKETSDLIYWTAYGVMLGGFLQTIINLPFLKEIGYSFKIILRFNTIAIKTLWNRFIPGMLGVGVREINLAASMIIASLLLEGSISSLGYGNRLMQLPLGIFGIAIGTVVLPEFSRTFTHQNWAELSETLKFAINFILFVLTPISVIMIMGSETFIRLLFQRGEFGETSVYLTKVAFIYYSAGLCFLGLNQVITPFFFATKDTKTPVIIAAFMVVMNIILCLTLMQFMAHAGIALAFSLCAMLQFTIKIIIIKRRYPELKISNMRANLLKLGVILVFLVGVLYFSRDAIYGVSTGDGVSTGGGAFLDNLVKSVIIIAISLVCLIVSFQVLKPDYYKEIAGKLVRKITRKI